MKKLFKITALGATVMACASLASAADIEFNIFGASAQGTFWKQTASEFLKDTYQCTDAKIVEAYRDLDGSVKDKDVAKAAIIIGDHCQLYSSGNVVIRYTESKSSEGPRAVYGVDPDTTTSCDTPGKETEREQIVYTQNPTTGAFSFSIGCHKVNIGASDVESKSFKQVTPGNDFSSIYIPGKDVLNARRPIIVPFSFFANTELPANNITRQQALMLFGQATGLFNWSQFGSDYPEKQIVVCMRHAGSGTHATLDKTIIRNDGISLVNSTNTDGDQAPITIWNASTSNEVACVNNNGGKNGTAIAIGYADSDKIVSGLNADGSEKISSSYTKVKRLTYNGAGEGMTPTNYGTYSSSALKNDIVNGKYDFWSAQWMYYSKSAPAGWVTELNKLMTYAAEAELACDPSDSTAKFTGCYWPKKSDMMIGKETDGDIAKFGIEME